MADRFAPSKLFISVRHSYAWYVRAFLSVLGCWFSSDLCPRKLWTLNDETPPAFTSILTKRKQKRASYFFLDPILHKACHVLGHGVLHRKRPILVGWRILHHRCFKMGKHHHVKTRVGKGKVRGAMLHTLSEFRYFEPP